jgi:hypothetical protein
MPWSWFDSTETVALAGELVENYCLRRQASQLNAKKQARLTQDSEALAQRVRAFNRRHRFNFYKRALLLQRLQRGLSERGIPASEATGVIDNLFLIGVESDRP